MRGVVLLGNREVEIRDYPEPEPGPGQVLVRMRASGLCGSDLHRYRVPPDQLGDRADVIMGHEPAGVVEAVGSGVLDLRPGDRVSVYHYVGCGRCRECRAGFLAACREARSIVPAGAGGMADYLTIDARNCLPLPEERSFEEGAMLACCAGTAFSALQKLSPTNKDTLVVYGLGPVGLLGVRLGQAMGARVIGIDIMPERRALALSLGASAAVDARDGDPARQVVELTHGRGATIGLEASGATSARQAIVSSMARRGRIAFVGHGSREPAINPSQFIGRELTLVGSFVLSIPQYFDLVDFLREKALSLEPVVTHRMRIEDAAEAFRLADRGVTGKVVFVWD